MHQSCGAWGIRELTGGRGEVGGGGEACLPRTDVIEGEGDGAWIEPALDSTRVEWATAQAITASIADIGGGMPWSGKTEARGMSEATPQVPGASEEGPGGTLPLSPSFPAPVSDAGVLPEGFPVLGGGGFRSKRGASTAITSAGCFSPDLRLQDLLHGFAALRALKKPGELLGVLRTSSPVENT